MSKKEVCVQDRQIKIKVENFQSISNVEMIIDGFTVITGENDIGKSAVLRALTFLMYGKKGDFFIRQNCKFCRVTLFFNGHSVIWEKERGSGQVYYVDDLERKKPLTKMKNIAEVGQLLGINLLSVEKIIIGERNYTPQVHHQAERYFSVDETDQQNYKNITALITEDGVDKVLKQIVSDKKTTSSQLNFLLAEIEKVSKNIQLYNTTKFLSLWDFLYTYAKELINLQKDMVLINKTYYDFLKIREEVASLKNRFFNWGKVKDNFIRFKTEYSYLYLLSIFISEFKKHTVIINKFDTFKKVVDQTHNLLSLINSSVKFIIEGKLFATLYGRREILINLIKEFKHFCLVISNLQLKTKWYLWDKMIGFYRGVFSQVKEFRNLNSLYKQTNLSLKIIEDNLKFGLTRRVFKDMYFGLTEIHNQIEKNSLQKKEYSNQKKELEQKLGVCPLCKRIFN